MKIVQKELSVLVPYEKNAKKHDETQINNVAESIKQFGFVQPIVVDKDNVIVIGHCRALAAERLGMEEVPCVSVDDLTEEQVKKLRIADNKSNESPWDFDLLYEDIEGLDFDGFDFGFDLYDDEEPIEITEDSISETAETRCKHGDIWKLGNHRLMCGDATSEDDVAKLMDGQKADMVFTDPPYGMGLDTDYSSMKGGLDIAQEKGIIGGKRYEQGVVDEFKPEMIDSILAIGTEEAFLWGADYYAELIPDKNNGS